jgi:hypothetical protein
MGWQLRLSKTQLKMASLQKEVVDQVSMRHI